MATAEFDASIKKGAISPDTLVALVFGTVQQHDGNRRLARRLQPNRYSPAGAPGRVCDMATTIGKFSIWSAIAVLAIALVAVAWVLAR